VHLTPPLFIDVTVPKQECAQSYIYVLGVSIVTLFLQFCNNILELFRQSDIFCLNINIQLCMGQCSLMQEIQITFLSEQ